MKTFIVGQFSFFVHFILYLFINHILQNTIQLTEWEYKNTKLEYKGGEECRGIRKILCVSEFNKRT